MGAKTSKQPEKTVRKRKRPEAKEKAIEEGSMTVKELVKVGGIPIHEDTKTYLLAVESGETLDSKVSIGAGLTESDNYNSSSINIHVSLPSKSDNESLQATTDRGAAFIEQNLGVKLKRVKQVLKEHSSNG